jgi:hypothetical protein
MQQKKSRKGGQQEHHAQMVAEPEGINRVEPGEPACSRRLGPRQQRERGGADQKEVERVNLGCDGLRPKRIGKGKI